MYSQIRSPSIVTHNTPLPSKSIPMVLPFYHPIVIASSYRKRHEITDEMEDNCIIFEGLLPHSLCYDGANVAPPQKFADSLVA
jgi:hypothetical protein